MGGLILLVAIVGWTAACVMLLRRGGRHIRSNSARRAFYIGMFPTLFALPLADELIGAYQFEQYCKQAEDVTILGTIPVGEELYFPDGRWRRSSSGISLEEARRIDDLVKQLLLYESTPYQGVPAVIAIARSEVRLKERKTGRTLATYAEYITRGGWISQNLEKPLVLRDACAPETRGVSLQKSLLPFYVAPNREDKK